MQKNLVIIAACLVLGLAPFYPEPHILGKIRWIHGGGEGMTLMDWWDTVLHGVPWLVILYLAFRGVFGKISGGKN